MGRWSCVRECKEGYNETAGESWKKKATKCLKIVHNLLCIWVKITNVLFVCWNGTFDNEKWEIYTTTGNCALWLYWCGFVILPLQEREKALQIPLNTNIVSHCTCMFCVQAFTWCWSQFITFDMKSATLYRWLFCMFSSLLMLIWNKRVLWMSFNGFEK